MAESKKVLVAFDPGKADTSSSDFLVPVKNESGEIEFLGTRSKKSIRYGLVILTSRAVTANDLFAKLVDTGRKVPNVADTLDTLGNFLDAMKTVKIGNVVEVVGGLENSITLVVASNTPSGFGK
jgi:hypothetical protein